MARILAINGSYRPGGINDQLVEVMTTVLRQSGAEVEVINLRDYPLEFCRNCRECTQQPGVAPGMCIIQDGMPALIEKIELCDGYILAAPTNFGTVTALFKRFMERLVVYAFWPWDMPAPKFRKQGTPPKKAIILASFAAPGLWGRLLMGSHGQLKKTAQTLGAHTVGVLSAGLVAKRSRPRLSPQLRKKAEHLAAKLI
ncbi:MAG: flavodoxin family protein [Desulfuromonadaceae bacterium]|jgi:putative NADPH-quinone reductase